MAIKRILFKNQFVVDCLPDWSCPNCKSGLLTGDSKSFKNFENAASLADRSEDEWEPEWIRGIFLGHLKCNNSSCNESVILTGNMNVSEDHEYDSRDDSWGLIRLTLLTPTCFNPPIHIFKIHNDVPKPISNEIINSFNTYWLDIASCANKIRIVVELIMDDKKIAKTYISKGKRRGYTLHKRIELFKVNDKDNAELLMAIKWIGNSGSHNNDTLTKDDILDGFEILEHVTTKLYETESLKIKKLSKSINKRKKPIGKNNPLARK